MYRSTEDKSHGELVRGFICSGYDLYSVGFGANATVCHRHRLIMYDCQQSKNSWPNMYFLLWFLCSYRQNLSIYLFTTNDMQQCNSFEIRQDELRIYSTMARATRVINYKQTNEKLSSVDCWWLSGRPDGVPYYNNLLCGFRLLHRSEHSQSVLSVKSNNIMGRYNVASILCRIN